jgi:hypothetical protein
MRRSRDAQWEGESDEQYSARLKSRADFVRQVQEEIRFAAAGQGLGLAEVSRRMGDPSGHRVSSHDGGISMAKLADIAFAMGVTFRLVAIPDRDLPRAPKAPSQANGARPRRDRRLTPEQVREIRARVAAGETHRLVGEAYGLGKSMVSHIASRKAYKDIVD